LDVDTERKHPTVTITIVQIGPLGRRDEFLPARLPLICHIAGLPRPPRFCHPEIPAAKVRSSAFVRESAFVTVRALLTSSFLATHPIPTDSLASSSGEMSTKCHDETAIPHSAHTTGFPWPIIPHRSHCSWRKRIVSFRAQRIVRMPVRQAVSIFL